MNEEHTHSPYGDCTFCGGDLLLLGQLGRVTHTQCRNCGLGHTEET